MKKRRFRIFALVTLLVLITAGFIANWYVKKKGYRNLWHFVQTAGSNYNKSRAAKYETLEIKISDDDYKKLDAFRKKALSRGVQINEGKEFVDATLVHNKKKIKAKVRLKGHMTDHLGDKKWSFRVHTKKGDAFMGMKIFTLQNPGTRNYIYEWIYHQFMKREGIVALRYDFVKLKVNGESWGIYAVEENFGQELVQHNHRVKGPIVRFDPDLYWVSRINELDKIGITEEYAQMQSAFIDVYDDKNTFADSSLMNRYVQAVRLMEAFRRGKMTTSQVFDVKKLAMFHAIIDLVGGHHSIDWSDIKYYFNPETNLLEPVAYESFSVNPVAQLAASYKFSTEKPGYIEDWHRALFSDSLFFREYMRCIDQVISKKWLDDFFAGIKTEMDNKLATIYNDYYLKDFSLDGYRQNQENIRHILASPAGFNAYLDHVSGDSLYLNIGGIDALPYEIKQISIDDSVSVKLKQPYIVNPKGKNTYVEYTKAGFPLQGLLKKKILPDSKITLKVSVLGHNQSVTQKVQMIGLPNENPYMDAPVPLKNFSFLLVNESKKEIVCQPGEHELRQTLVIPTGYVFKMYGGTTIKFAQHAGIISHSPVHIQGSDDFPVTFASESDHSGFVALVQTGDKKSLFDQVQFINGGWNNDPGLASALRIYQSPAVLTNCVFNGQPYDALRITDSHVEISGCVFSGIGQTALKLSYCDVEIRQTNVLNAKNGIELKGAKAVTSDLKLDNLKKTGVDVSESSYFQGSRISIQKCQTGLNCVDRSLANIIGLQLTGNDLGLKSHKKGDVYGPSVINIRNLTEKENKVLQEKEKKSQINIAA